MSKTIDVPVPDIGDFDSVDVIEILVQVGDSVAVEDSLLTLESDKATMEIPSPVAGVVESIEVAVGDQVAEGTVIVRIAEGADAPANGQTETPEKAPAPAQTEAPPSPAPAAAASPADAVDIRVPDIGDFDKVEVIEILVGTGDEINVESSLVTLESDKATMEIPSPQSGTVGEIKVALGDMVSEGDVLLTLIPGEGVAAADTAERTTTARSAPSESPAVERQTAIMANEPKQAPEPRRDTAPDPGQAVSAEAYASPSVRRFARELGVDLNAVSGSGRKGRIIQEDVKAFVKASFSSGSLTAGSRTPAPLVSLDFSKFGTTTLKPLSKIRRLSGQNLTASWTSIPHVTQFDEADVTELEAFRKSRKEELAADGIKLTLVSFVIKASANALRRFPDFNASLAADGEQLIMKDYCNIGFAVDTPDGLLVPVVKDADKKSLTDVAAEVQSLSEKARNKRLGPADMQGACFTITSLGGIGGTAFTPIINPPEVAILGLSRSIMKPVWTDGAFEPRLMLPLSLSYDHRVIDGVAGAHFTGYLAQVLADIRLLLI